MSDLAFGARPLDPSPKLLVFPDELLEARLVEPDRAIGDVEIRARAERGEETLDELRGERRGQANASSRVRRVVPGRATFRSE